MATPEICLQALHRYTSCINDLEPEENATYNLGQGRTVSETIAAALKTNQGSETVRQLAQKVVEKVDRVLDESTSEEEFVDSMTYLENVTLAVGLVDLTEDVERVMVKVRKALNSTPASCKWKKLKPDVLAFYRNGTRKPLPTTNGLTRYARDDGVISALSYEQAEGNDEECTVSQRYLKELNSMEPSFLPDMESKIGEREAKEVLEKIVTILSDDFFNKPADYQKAILKLFKSFFVKLDAHLKTSTCEAFFSSFIQGIEGIQKIENYQKDLTTAVNLIEDHQQMNNDPEKFKKACDELSWFLLISPEDTITRLCFQCLDNQGFTPVVVKIFSTMRPLFNIRRSTEPLVGSILTSVYEKNHQRWQNTEQLNNFFYFASSLTKRRKGCEEELLSTNFLLNRLILPILFDKSVKGHYHETVLAVLARLLGIKEITFKWATRKGENYLETGYAPTPELVILLRDIFFNSPATEVGTLVKKILKNLGGKLKEDDVIFDKRTQIELLRALNENPWWFKFAIGTWLQSSLGVPIIQVPSGLFKTLPVRLHNRYDEIHTDFVSSAAECFAKAIFELAFFDPELAIGQLENGIYKKIDEDEMSIKLALALFDVYRETEVVPKTATLAEVVRKLMTKIDIPFSTRRVETVTQAQFESLKNTAYLVVFSEATKIAFLQKEGKDLSITLLDVFCEAVKAHLDSKMDALKNDKYKLRRLDFQDPNLEDEKLKMELSEKVLMFEVVQLFKEACFFTKLVGDGITTKLRLLLVALIDAQTELQKAMANGFLDEVPTASAKTDTFYAYATDKNCAENRLFSGVNGVVSQIASPALRSQIETRLSGSTGETKKDMSATATTTTTTKTKYSKGGHKKQNR